MTEIRKLPDAAAVARAATELFIKQAHQTRVTGRPFNVALSGGSTPKAMFKLLAEAEYARRVHWSDVHLFWSDERTVPPDHEDSNYGTTKTHLLDHINIPAANIHRIHGEDDPAQAAASYENLIRRHFGDALLPRFDLIYLGMGDDGHTASLFPHTAALIETERLIVENYVAKLGIWRITFTVPLINAAQRVVFLVTGENKAKRLSEVINGPREPDRLPSQLIQPTDGELLWLIDEAAGQLL
ncbi:MAG: 6-phosphogluconolactonase [Chloroflexi bacterium]|nr:MAG: 6-phosphogluconolactonase [Chloroflexota bacterium]